MKFLVVFALALATVSAKKLYFRSIKAPLLENEGRITNGQDAAPGKFKYQAGLSLTKGLIEQWCGGSLIGTNWILSAAHCTVGVSSATVYLGATERTAAEKVYTAPKGDIITHPAYNPIISKNDISLIRIPTTSESSRIGIIKFPNNSNRYVGYSVVVSGWGSISDTAKVLTNNLHYAVLKVSPASVCSEVYNSHFGDDTRICVANINGVAACLGDSGGPLVLTGQNLQIGLVSYVHRDGCDKRLPVVFTRVGTYRFWIKSHTGIIGISK